jgi:uncharacterized membrane protein YgcG
MLHQLYMTMSISTWILLSCMDLRNVNKITITHPFFYLDRIKKNLVASLILWIQVVMCCLNLCTVLLQFVYLFVKRMFGGKTALDLASQKPELLALVKRFISFSPSLNGHQGISASVHQLEHSSGVMSGGSSTGGGRVHRVSVSGVHYCMYPLAGLL